MATGYTYQGQCLSANEVRNFATGTTVGNGVITGCTGDGSTGFTCIVASPGVTDTTVLLELPTCADTSLIDFGSAPLVISIVLCYALGLIAGLLS